MTKPNLLNPEENAAHNLVGLDLKDGWRVVEKLTKKPHSTGSFFSVTYKVQKGDAFGFLKAFDIAKFISIAPQNQSVIDVLNDMTNAFRYERDLSIYCKNHYVTKISIAHDDGELEVSGFTIPYVPYLTFELADGDVRDFLDFSQELDFVWIFKSLHSIAVGLKQLHAIDVAHHDIKPSNVLVFGQGRDFKIGDLGRSTCASLVAPHQNNPFPGDINYAPPEILYRHFIPDAALRSYYTDLYQFGSMMAFYFTGLNMSALLVSNIPQQFAWTKWKGSFDEVEVYLLSSFSQVLEQIAPSIPEPFREDVLRLIEKVCYPIPEQRGLGNSNSVRDPLLTFERIVSKLDILLHKARYNLTH